MPKRAILDHDQHESFGQRLARLRKERGITQVQLAKRLKITQSNVSAYEHDNLRLHADIIVALTKILGVTSDELLGIRPSVRVPIKDRRFLSELGVIDALSKRDRDALLRTIRTYGSKARFEAAHPGRAAAK